jgi:hypothetical protein
MHEVTEFYDLTNAAVVGWNSALARACVIQPTSHPELYTSETITQLTGLLPLYPFDVPEGMVATGPMTIASGVSTPVDADDPRHKITCLGCEGSGEASNSDGEPCPACGGTGWTLDPDAAYREYATITIEQHEADRAAYEAEQAVIAAQAAHTRLLGLVDAYGADVAIMGRLLALFPDPATGEPITFPCEASDVMASIKGGLATGQIALDMAPYAQTLEERYERVRQGMSDSEIAAVAAILAGRL